MLNIIAFKRYRREEDVEEKQQLFEKAAARSRSHPNSLPPLSTWPIIVLIYAPAHITISLIVAVLAGDCHREKDVADNIVAGRAAAKKLISAAAFERLTVTGPRAILDDAAPHKVFP